MQVTGLTARDKNLGRTCDSRIYVRLAESQTFAVVTTGVVGEPKVEWVRNESVGRGDHIEQKVGWKPSPRGVDLSCYCARSIYISWILDTTRISDRDILYWISEKEKKKLRDDREENLIAFLRVLLSFDFLFRFFIFSILFSFFFKFSLISYLFRYQLFRYITWQYTNNLTYLLIICI